MCDVNYEISLRRLRRQQFKLRIPGPAPAVPARPLNRESLHLFKIRLRPLKGVVPVGSDKDYDFDIIRYLLETKQLRVSDIYTPLNFQIPVSSDRNGQCDH